MAASQVIEAERIRVEVADLLREPSGSLPRVRDRNDKVNTIIPILLRYPSNSYQYFFATFT